MVFFFQYYHVVKRKANLIYCLAVRLRPMLARQYKNINLVLQHAKSTLNVFFFVLLTSMQSISLILWYGSGLNEGSTGTLAEIHSASWQSMSLLLWYDSAMDVRK